MPWRLEPSAVKLRRMDMRRIRLAVRSVLVALAGCVVTGCGAAQGRDGTSSKAPTAEDAATALCSDADTEAKRARCLAHDREGSAKPYWWTATGSLTGRYSVEDLPGDGAAAWCTLQRADSYAVSAATANAPLVDFMTSDRPPGDFPDGPSVP